MTKVTELRDLRFPIPGTGDETLRLPFRIPENPLHVSSVCRLHRQCLEVLKDIWVLQKKFPCKKKQKAPPEGGPAFGRPGKNISRKFRPGKNMESTCPKGRPSAGREKTPPKNPGSYSPFRILKINREWDFEKTENCLTLGNNGK